MRIQNVLRVAAASAFYCGAQLASAGTIYDAALFDGATQRRELSIRVLVEERDARVDVSDKGHLKVSLIESGDKVTLVDHAAGIYVVGDSARSDSALAPVASRALSAKLFALGSYCPAVETHWTESVYQVECSTVTGGVSHNKGELAPRRTKVGEFLRLAAATRDPKQLFDRATRLLTVRIEEVRFPFVVRHFEAGRMLGELRMLGTTERHISPKVFTVPRGLRKVSLDTAERQTKIQ